MRVEYRTLSKEGSEQDRTSEGGVSGSSQRVVADHETDGAPRYVFTHAKKESTSQKDPSR